MEEKKEASDADLNFGWSSASPTGAHAYLWPAIESLLPSRVKTAIDLGCGNGYVASQLAAKGIEVVGVDQSADGVKVARAAHPGVRFERRSVYDDLSDLASDVDLVVSSEVIEHLYYPERLIINAHSLLRPGGALILTTPYHGYLKNLALSLAGAWDTHFDTESAGGHIKFFSEKTITRLLNLHGFGSPLFQNAGRAPWLWKSMVLRTERGG